MRKLGPVVASAATIFVLAAGTAGAGQPGADCEHDPGSNPPPGFSTTGFDHATNTYAGADGNPATNSHAVSQYDIACVSGRAR